MDYTKEDKVTMTTQLFELGKEYPPDGEEALIQKILEMSNLSMEAKPHPPTLRDQHPKSHGYLEGEFIVEDNISDKLPDGFTQKDFKIGVFAKPKKYPIWIRFSNGGSDRSEDGNFLPDTSGDIRGMAIKLMGVDGKMIIDDQNHQGEQDFILINNSTFFIRDVQGYIDFFPVLQAIKKSIREGKLTSDNKPIIPDELKAQFGKINYAFPLIEKIKEKVKETYSPLGINYWSATPYLLAEKAMKFSVVPHLTDVSFNSDTATDKSNYLREAMTKHLDSQDAYFDFKIQLQTDASEMPIEDPLKEWDEQKSPYVKVATIKIPKQDFNTDQRKQLDEKQSFSPWHSLREHRPLGGVNRARKIYVELAKIRNERN
jgi:hypothetical protein